MPRLSIPSGRSLLLIPLLLAQHVACIQTGVSADDSSLAFALNGNKVSYRMHVDEATGDLIGDHFGAPTYEAVPAVVPEIHGWVGLPGRARREFPDLGRGDFRTPAVRVRQAAGYAVSDLRYQSHEVVAGKPPLPGLPCLRDEDGAASTTLVVRLYDNYSAIAADLTYTVFPAYDAVVRSVNITNLGDANVTVEKLASFSVDLPYADLDMIELRGDWARENMRTRRKVEYGTQGFGSTTGYSSHLHNPFLALVAPTTTESQGEAWGFSLVYTGSFQAEVERGSQGLVRAMLGFNPLHLSWPLAPGETLTSPEVVAVYSPDEGVGGLSRAYHRLWRDHLIRSDVRTQTRPVLLNSWEGLRFDYNQSTIYDLAAASAALGVKLFVLDDGWFGEQYPRVEDDAGLGDWEVNTERFPSGSLAPLVDQVTNLTAANSTTQLRFGLWFEPEMVNPNSSLYQAHPDWVLAAGPYPRTLRRDQLVLDVARPDVQDFIIDSVSRILASAAISYVKWDNNRGMHELPAPGADHAYLLGLYRVLDVLTTRFPDVLWEGCASGGGRFDPGALQYFPQMWTSDNTDALARLAIQFGTSLVYPPSTMGAHVSAVPNGQTGRTIPVAFRAHVAMMAGSFGLELDPAETPPDDLAALPALIRLAERVAPHIVAGDLYRLALPEDSNWPAALFLAPGGAAGVLFVFQVRSVWNQALPYLRLQGLDPAARYRVSVDNGDGTGDEGGAPAPLEYAGSTLMGTGLQFALQGDYNSTVMFIDRV